jgi:two-component system nitrogen regulation response regulator NtrX
MKILIVDDNEDVLSSLKGVFTEYEILTADSIASAKKNLENENTDVAIIDIMLGEEDGLELLRHIKSCFPAIECIMISGYSTIEKAVLSIKMGAFDFVEKPISYQRMKVVIHNALEHKRFSQIIQKELDKYKMVGASSALKKLNEMIEKAAQTDFPVLIMGESGVGKEHIAHLIHLKSKRSEDEMIKLNCSAIPENLFESELFGYEKGAFTGAGSMKKGKIELAASGTLFMDEIGEMPLSQQAKLLRVLEDKELTRLGGERKIKADFRLICATNKDLKEAVKENKFREDFYYRIGVLILEVPPLRERKEDIPALAANFFEEACNENGGVMKDITDSALEAIASLPFKGNIRELKNLMQRIFVFSESSKIDASEIKRIIQIPDKGQNNSLFDKTMPYQEAKKILEKTYIDTQLRLHNGNISKTAVSLGILPNNLMRKIKDLNLN